VLEMDMRTGTLCFQKSIAAAKYYKKAVLSQETTARCRTLVQKAG